MQKQKCSLKLYTNFLIANQNRYSGVELAKVTPIKGMRHDSVTRWLIKANYQPQELWEIVKKRINHKTGYLVVDDTLIDKRYSRQNELAKKQYSGKEHGLVNGICLVNLLWTDSEQLLPVDYRIYNKGKDRKTKNDHFQDILIRAKQRGFKPKYILMDSWYSGFENLKLISKKLEWNFICSLKSNRQINVRQGEYMPIADLDLTDKQVRKVWLKGYGFVLVCKIVNKNNDITYLATNNLSLTDYEEFTNHFHSRWDIEEFHRAIKGTTGIEKCYSTKADSQMTHIFASFTAYLKLEAVRFKEHVSWYEQKASISRASSSAYLLNFSNA
jgi:putative transposase